MKHPLNRFVVPCSVVHGICTKQQYERHRCQGVSVPPDSKGNGTGILLLQQRVDCAAGSYCNSGRLYSKGRSQKRRIWKSCGFSHRHPYISNVKNASLKSNQKPFLAWEQRLRLQKFGVSLSLRLSHIATAMLLLLRYKSISDFLACVFTYVIKQPLRSQKSVQPVFLSA